MSRESHNQGQSDSSEGKYANPRGLMDQLTDFISSSDEEWAANARESEDYDKGWNHSNKQK